MGKVIHRDLPADHPIFTSDWSIASVRRLSKKDKKPSKKKEVVKDNKEGVDG